jgi:chlorite dismutase
VTFVGGAEGGYQIDSMRTLSGEALAPAPRLAVHEGVWHGPEDAAWSLRGVSGHVRYVELAEKQRLAAMTPPLGRPEASLAALIPIRKNEAWWNLAQDERRAILEARSQHIAIGLRYLPAVARRLSHSRELGEPFDFLTWFEYAPESAAQFEELLQALRATEEWIYVEREIDIRLRRQ